MAAELSLLSRPLRRKELNLELLQEFEDLLHPYTPEQSGIPCRVLGYGEISTVFEILMEDFKGLAVKRMSVFETREEVAIYSEIYDTYNHLLEQEVGLKLPDHGFACLTSPSGRPIFYIIQRKVPANAIGSNAIHMLPEKDIHALFHRVLSELRKVWSFNQESTDYKIAIDGQISNWAIADFDSRDPRYQPETPLIYLDTSTPLVRIGSQEQLDPELFLRSAPSFLVWIIRLLFMEEVMTRYYDPHRVIVELLANLYKEGRPELIPGLIELTNIYLGSEAGNFQVDPINERELRSYYREDALIWTLYLAMRRFDRLLHRWVLRREYPYLLPGPVRR